MVSSWHSSSWETGKNSLQHFISVLSSFLLLYSFIHFTNHDMLATEIQDYIEKHSNIEDDVLNEVERSTNLHTLFPQMLSGRLQGKFLTLLTSLVNARHVLEIGTFTGFGSICLARGLNSNEGKVVTIDVNPEFSFLVKKHLELAGVADHAEALVGDALKLIPLRKEIWDVVYIDANKQEYIEYY